MPNRVIRNWTLSKRVAKLSAEEERMLLRLVMIVDDYGRFHADPTMLRSLCFPRLDTITAVQVAAWLKSLHEIIIFYKHKGNDYLEIYEFNQTVRIKKEKFPKPSESDISEFESRCLADDKQMQERCTPETKPNQTETKPKTNPKRIRNEVPFDESKVPHAECMNIYNDWMLKTTGATAKIDGRQGKALKEILSWLSIQDKVSGDREKIIESWQWILNSWDKIEPFLQKQKTLSQINTNLNNITDQLKNGIPSNQQNQQYKQQINKPNSPLHQGLMGN